MGRCSCGGTSGCACVIQGDGSTITVTGTGTVGSPYVVSSTGSDTAVEILDTASLNLTITGSGTSADPYIISGVVIPNNLENLNTVAASGATETLPDVDVATVHEVTLDANCTFTFPALPGAGLVKSFTLELIQGGVGSFTATWPGTVKWPGGTPPVLTTTVGKSDVFSFMSSGASWLGFVAGQNY